MFPFSALPPAPGACRTGRKSRRPPGGRGVAERGAPGGLRPTPRSPAQSPCWPLAAVQQCAAGGWLGPHVSIVGPLPGEECGRGPQARGLRASPPPPSRGCRARSSAPRGAPWLPPSGMPEGPPVAPPLQDSPPPTRSGRPASKPASRPGPSTSPGHLAWHPTPAGRRWHWAWVPRGCHSLHLGLPLARHDMQTVNIY